MNYEQQNQLQSYAAEYCQMDGQSKFAEYLVMLAMLLMLASLVASAFLTALGT